LSFSHYCKVPEENHLSASHHCSHRRLGSVLILDRMKYNKP
jgi:hypothetical protein